MTVLTHDRGPVVPEPIPTRRRRWPLVVAVLAVCTVAVAALGLVVVRYLHDDSRRHYLGADGWPARGQAAYSLGSGPSYLSPRQRPAPIASVAKVMTALLVLRSAPLAHGSDGFRLRLTARDVADTARRRALDQSTVPVAAGEQLTERAALAALLLPSANNIAALLARHVSGSVPAFVTRMNATARSLGMRDTRYTDPSGFLATTVSTAGDQLRLASVAMREPGFARLVALRSYRIPVAGVVHNTDALLGRDGFVGIKTGSMDASGGCFVFRIRRVVDGRVRVLTGVVLGQRGHNLVRAGLYSADQMSRRVFSHAP